MFGLAAEPLPVIFPANTQEILKLGASEGICNLEEALAELVAFGAFGSSAEALNRPNDNWYVSATLVIVMMRKSHDNSILLRLRVMRNLVLAFGTLVCVVDDLVPLSHAALDLFEVLASARHPL